MPKFPFDPPVLSARDLPVVMLVALSAFGLLAVFVAVLQPNFFPEIAAWKLYVMFVAGLATSHLISFLVVRPMRGMPPIFRKRYTDDFETWMGGNGLRWSRIYERYTTQELILLVAVISMLFAFTMAWAIRI